MASTGIRRKVDDLGRVVIPADVRRSLNIREGDAVEVTVDGERVVLAKPREACVFCGREDDTLRSYRSRLVCRDCLGALGVLDERARTAETAEGGGDGAVRPVDGDDLARRREPEPPPPRRRRRPPQDAASTTAW